MCEYGWWDYGAYMVISCNYSCWSTWQLWCAGSEESIESVAAKGCVAYRRFHCMRQMPCGVWSEYNLNVWHGRDYGVCMCMWLARYGDGNPVVNWTSVVSFPHCLVIFAKRLFNPEMLFFLWRCHYIPCFKNHITVQKKSNSNNT